ncbi:MAG: hypothetical protein CMC13_15870 [Flavobacteriaceae bacterium]|nr:hypothetical protein [Flavobacteriaceae bacterium]
MSRKATKKVPLGYQEHLGQGLGSLLCHYNIPSACLASSLTFVASIPLFLFPCRKKATKKAPTGYQEHLGRVLVSLLGFITSLGLALFIHSPV